MSSRLALAMSAAALVVALLGSTPLGHALASQVPRNSVGPLQIKRNAVGPQKIAPNAVRTGHVLDGSLLTVDFKAGQIPQGPKGDKGEKGDRGSPGIAEREVVTASTPSDSTNLKGLDPTCPAGKQPTGGGTILTGGTLGGQVLASSAPTLNGWFGLAYEAVATDRSWSLQVRVICAKVSP